MPTNPPNEADLTTSEWEAITAAANQQGNDLDGNPWTVTSVQAVYPNRTNAQKRHLRLLALFVIAS